MSTTRPDRRAERAALDALGVPLHPAMRRSEVRGAVEREQGRIAPTLLTYYEALALRAAEREERKSARIRRPVVKHAGRRSTRRVPGRR